MCLSIGGLTGAGSAAYFTEYSETHNCFIAPAIAAGVLCILTFFMDAKIERDENYPEGVEGTWISTKVGGGVVNSFKLLWGAL